jgi:hypothetical protein
MDIFASSGQAPPPTLPPPEGTALPTSDTPIQPKIEESSTVKPTEPIVAAHPVDAVGPPASHLFEPFVPPTAETQVASEVVNNQETASATIETAAQPEKTAAQIAQEKLDSPTLQIPPMQTQPVENPVSEPVAPPPVPVIPVISEATPTVSAEPIPAPAPAPAPLAVTPDIQPPAAETAVVPPVQEPEVVTHAEKPLDLSAVVTAQQHAIQTAPPQKETALVDQSVGPEIDEEKTIPHVNPVSSPKGLPNGGDEEVERIVASGDLG